MILLSLKKRKKNHTEQDQVNRQVLPVRRCSSRLGTVGYSGRCELQWLEKAKITVIVAKKMATYFVKPSDSVSCVSCVGKKRKK